VLWTTNPYALAKLSSKGEVYWGEIHAAPRHNYHQTKAYGDDDVRELLATSPTVFDVDNAITKLRDQSLRGEVHRYRSMMARLKQLNDCKDLQGLTAGLRRLVSLDHFEARTLAAFLLVEGVGPLCKAKGTGIHKHTQMNSQS